ncbi:MAG: peptide deformylase [Candidatus Omnitrophota bacterium]|jgi:peptide deformylase|nr:peptide deformylase [Candidatus Omnitrophota bacterium]MDD5518238.1 peptide deformylase [Candidatus Omnitrophota bacterium]
MEKTALRIRKFGDLALRKKAGLVKKITPGHRDILNGMARLMYDGEGIGLAASQVGLDQAMIVVDIGKGLYKIVNPKVVKALGTQVNLEGCLSVPGVCIKVKRANKIKVTGLDENSEPLNIEVEGLLACVFQHEIDHLKGRLIVDYASFLEKIKIARVLKEIKKKAEHENLSESTKKSCKLQL